MSWGAPTERELREMESAASSAKRMALKMEGLERAQTGSIRGERKRKRARQQAKRARKKNR